MGEGALHNLEINDKISCLRNIAFYPLYHPLVLVCNHSILQKSEQHESEGAIVKLKAKTSL